MAPLTFDEFLAGYGHTAGGYPILDLDAADLQRSTVVVTVAGGAAKAIVQCIGLAVPDTGLRARGQLCIVVHAFVDDRAARTQVFGTEHDGRRSGRGRPAASGVSVLIGAPAGTPAQPQPEPQS